MNTTSSSSFALVDACIALEAGLSAADLHEARFEVGMPMFEGKPSWPRAGSVCLRAYKAELEMAHSRNAPPSPRMVAYIARRASAAQ